MNSILNPGILIMLICFVDPAQQLHLLLAKKVDIALVDSISDFCNYFDSGNKIRYGFGNDDSVFYLKLEFLDEDIARRVAVNGLNVYFDATCKKKKDIYLNFPESFDPGQMKGQRGNFPDRSMNSDQGEMPAPRENVIPAFLYRMFLPWLLSKETD